MIKRVSATDLTVSLIDELVNIHGPVLFHQSGGCCDGSAPMCFPRGDFRVGSRDVFLGTINNQPFFMAYEQYAYWEHTHLMIDVVPGRGGMFSIEGPTGKRFLTRSRVFSDEEVLILKNQPPVRASEISDIEGLKTTS
tara:strand:- start:2041 stop:2454 length:414 start_codon:yes stop_codon:yes gene_type:complete